MKWSVVIPVKLGDLGVLRKILSSWENVNYSQDEFEIILSCDGYDSRVDEFQGRNIRIIFANPAGQSAATNNGVRHATGEFLLLSAQDIEPHPDLLLEHEKASGENRAVLGYIPYAPFLSDRPFLRFLMNGGPQFAFYLLKDAQKDIAPSFFYAPNVSLRRDLFLSYGGFRTDFPYGCQDSELGIRLALDGVSLRYNERAIGWHWHPQTVETYIPRQYQAGRSTVQLALLHPRQVRIETLKEKVLDYYHEINISTWEAEIPRFEAMSEYERSFWKVRVGQSPLGPVEQEALRFLYDRITKYHFFRGVFDAISEREGEDWIEVYYYSWAGRGRKPQVEFFRETSLVHMGEEK